MKGFTISAILSLAGATTLLQDGIYYNNDTNTVGLVPSILGEVTLEDVEKYLSTYDIAAVAVGSVDEVTTRIMASSHSLDGQSHELVAKQDPTPVSLSKRDCPDAPSNIYVGQYDQGGCGNGLYRQFDLPPGQCRQDIGDGSLGVKNNGGTASHFWLYWNRGCHTHTNLSGYWIQGGEWVCIDSTNKRSAWVDWPGCNHP